MEIDRMTEKPKRKRNAPKGKKQGFYAKVLDEAEQLDFELAAINSGRLKVYARDGSDECRKFWKEMERAKCHYRPSQTINFYVSPSEGHDDFLMSLALLVEAAERYEPREARGEVRG
jgi:hypothetical protein